MANVEIQIYLKLVNNKKKTRDDIYFKLIHLISMLLNYLLHVLFMLIKYSNFLKTKFKLYQLNSIYLASSFIFLVPIKVN
jgi:hypothetical protein